jgi:hypothetical protein
MSLAVKCSAAWLRHAAPCYDFQQVVSVAQLVEHRSVAPRVAGSNPVAHPNSFNQLAPAEFFGFAHSLHKAG